MDPKRVTSLSLLDRARHHDERGAPSHHERHDEELPTLEDFRDALFRAEGRRC